MMSPKDTAVLFEKVQGDLLALCDTLEEIADSLPENVDRQTCIHTARALGSVMASAHQLEENVLFPYLEAVQPIVLDPPATFERLRLEHAGDACFVEELSEVLMSYGAGAPQQNAEATGYMLRAFFEALRRHIAFEREIFGPMIAGLKQDAPGTLQ